MVEPRHVETAQATLRQRNLDGPTRGVTLPEALSRLRDEGSARFAAELVADAHGKFDLKGLHASIQCKESKDFADDDADAVKEIDDSHALARDGSRHFAAFATHPISGVTVPVMHGIYLPRNKDLDKTA
jgi:hypothetical protein